MVIISDVFAKNNIKKKFKLHIINYTEICFSWRHISSKGGYIMNSIDLTPLYSSSIGFDSLASLIDSALTETVASDYPSYNIEIQDENKYTISLDVAGFERDELEMLVETNVLKISGKKAHHEEHKYLHHGIVGSAFERNFDLADYVVVTSADFRNGLLTIHLVKQLPEAMKPKKITINEGTKLIEH